jgi:hypothetical protein
MGATTLHQCVEVLKIKHGILLDLGFLSASVKMQFMLEDVCFVALHPPSSIFLHPSHLELGRQWEVIAFHMICMDRRVCTIFM